MSATITRVTMDSTEAPSDTYLSPSDGRSTRRVLVAVHTDASRLYPVLRVATGLAAVRRSPLTVATVLTGPETSGASLETSETATRETSSSILQRTEMLLRLAVSQVEPAFFVEPKRNMCDTHVLTGDPDYEIPSLINSINADVLVIGRGEVGHGGKVLDVILRGMRSARVYQASPVPVIAVADPHDGRHPLDTVVVATDFSPASWKAAAMAVQAAPHGACFHIVHVMDDRELTPVSQQTKCEAVHAALASWSAPLIALLPSGATFQTAVLRGESYSTLAAFLQTVKATCVVVGGHQLRHNTISVVGRTVPERLLAAWRGSIVISPYQENKDVQALS